MVSLSAIIGIVLTLIITLILPVAIWIIFAKKIKGISRAISRTGIFPQVLFESHFSEWYNQPMYSREL